MPSIEPERVHRDCPTCQCEPKRSGRVVLYPPNRILYGECEQCRKVRWVAEIWTHRKGSWTPVQRQHCGCCPPDCPTHDRKALAREKGVQA